MNTHQIAETCESVLPLADTPQAKQIRVEQIKSAIEKATVSIERSRDFYKERCDNLQKAQSEMRDPERQMVCDILANGYRDKAIEQSRAAHASEPDDTKRMEIWKQANIVCALSGAVANDCDHHGIKRPSWWRAVKKLQKLINSYAAMPQTKEKE